MQTLLNPYENIKMLVTGEGFFEDIVFEGLPRESEDELNLGDCIINQEKRVNFTLRNNAAEAVRFRWNT
jgi:hydrocephalus-inducing protein